MEKFPHKAQNYLTLTKQEITSTAKKERKIRCPLTEFLLTTCIISLISLYLVGILLQSD